MSRSTTLLEIRNRIEKAPRGSLFVTSDFTDISAKEKIGVAFSRLQKEGLIRRIMRGVYDKPVYNNFIKEFVEPSPDKVAHALARNFGWTIIPCGDTALNLLGLSTQVPAVWIYLSDGVYKEYTYGNMHIKFKKTANKEISKISYKTGLIIQALKTLGKDNINKTVINKISTQLTRIEKEKMLIEAKTTTSWIYDEIKEICGDKL